MLSYLCGGRDGHLQHRTSAHQNSDPSPLVTNCEASCKLLSRSGHACPQRGCCYGLAPVPQIHMLECTPTDLRVGVLCLEMGPHRE